VRKSIKYIQVHGVTNSRNKVSAMQIDSVQIEGINHYLFNATKDFTTRTSPARFNTKIAGDLLISIIMPVFNPPIRHLKSAIESVIGQQYKNWELLVIDDASTNSDVHDFLKTIESNNQITVIYKKNNIGISAASNEGLNIASGRYIALLDNDDVLTNDALLYAVKKLRKQMQMSSTVTKR